MDILLKEQNVTGGGQLKPRERRIVNSLGYLELANKLGKSAKGNSPRFDSDSEVTCVSAPTERLRARLTARIFSTDSNLNEENTMDGSKILNQSIFDYFMYLFK